MAYVILGIDPGSRTTGAGIISVQGTQSTHLDHITIQAPHKQLPERLKHIYTHILELIQTYQPHHLAIEQAFTHLNPQTALKLGQARAMAILAAAQNNMMIYEYAPRQIKQAITGYGAADKTQMQHMVRAILSLTQTPQSDAADALAVALCHAQHYHHAKRTQAALSKA